MAAIDVGARGIATDRPRPRGAPVRAYRVAERLPACTATFDDRDGNVSVLAEHGREILDAMVN